MAFANLARDEPEFLVSALLDATPTSLPVVVKALARHPEFVRLRLDSALKREAPANATQADRDELAETQARLAVAAIGAGRGESAWPLLRFERDPRRRSALLALLAIAGTTTEEIARRLATTPTKEDGSRFALVLALGDHRPGSLAADQRAQWVEWLAQTYREADDAGVHSAAGWVLSRWGETELVAQLDEALRGRRVEGRSWFVDSLGQTMAIVRPSAERDPRLPRPGRDYAVATREVTVKLIREFAPDYKPSKHLVRDELAPATTVSMRKAIAFCRWRTVREGMGEADQCYPDPELIDWRDPNARVECRLDRRGYRLPTEAEFECAIRGGADRQRFAWGKELLPGGKWQANIWQGEFPFENTEEDGFARAAPTADDKQLAVVADAGQRPIQ